MDAIISAMTTGVNMVLSELELRSRSGETLFAPMGEEAFRAFYERTARPVWAYLRRITGDEHLADDFLQEAYYRFFRSTTVHESESHRRNYLYRIATNLVRDHARRHRHGYDVPLPEPDDPHEPRDETQGPHHLDGRMDLGRAMNQMEPLQRQILWLAYAQGSSHEEIAGVVGVTRGNVKSLLYRARRKLALLLGGTIARGDREIAGGDRE
jgi:RNA polymerase sigma-70 factor (ECF subfamily)